MSTLFSKQEEIVKITFKELISNLKLELKKLTEDYKKLHDHGSSLYVELRSKHIAYCLLRGRTLDQIEKPRKQKGTRHLLVDGQWVPQTFEYDNGLTITCHTRAKLLLTKYKLEIQD